ALTLGCLGQAVMGVNELSIGVTSPIALCVRSSVVLSPPDFNHELDLRHCQKPVLVQSHSRNVALTRSIKHIVNWLAGLNKVSGDPTLEAEASKACPANSWPLSRVKTSGNGRATNS